MPAVPPSDLLAALNWRYAVKKFDATKKIPADTWAALEQCLLLSPSSYGLQPWKFFVVETPALREQLLPHSWGQRQIVDADKLVVFAVKKDVGVADADRLIARTAAVRGIPADALAGYRGMMAGSLTKTPPDAVDVWMSRQVFIALGVFLTTAAALGVDACPMEGFVPEQYDEILGLTAKGYASRVVATAGYRAADDAYAGLKKVRYELGEVVEKV
ncbi:MAG: NAD(P)H-dependent oxidoreductase [Fimbriiglobus sp.]|jgi:nitroreductase|nr:NAD(P)H-dependent oxidoreductase [Fimbriiglobus sp.]